MKILNRTKDRAEEVARAFILKFPSKKMESFGLTKDSVESSISDKVDLFINTIPSSVSFPFEVNFSCSRRRYEVF